MPPGQVEARWHTPPLLCQHRAKQLEGMVEGLEHVRPKEREDAEESPLLLATPRPGGGDHGRVGFGDDEGLGLALPHHRVAQVEGEGEGSGILQVCA